MKLVLRRLVAVGAVVLGLAMANVAFAVPIVAVPVASIGSSADPLFGNVGSDGTIFFYIPLENDVEIYGVGGGGLSADTCNYPESCDGGSLTMYLFFESMSGVGDVDILFTDLDETGFNDPWFFLEDIILYDGNGVEITSYALTGNNFQQEMTFSVNFTGSAYLELVFNSTFDQNTPNGWYTNTSEALYATVTSVPEPGTLALLGIGLAGMGLARRRRKV